ncbi:hypothetical protein BC941DRAFT_442664 [Chlamydoabsidia padenii]|nr:hypothetical protein BC941DRAFT_442664 [Chlamydoabsidia padenii]
MEMDLDDYPSSPQELQDQNELQDQPSQDQPSPPVKIRKKPGRKPNPASPALRKAQNRAAQRAFRERKERHMRELEATIKQIREQRDKLYLENEQLKGDAEINRSENWYLKGIVLTLQLVCYQHNLAIPQHGPFINDQALSVMAQSTPEPIAAYLSVNANSKLPTPTLLSGYRHSIKQRDRYLSSGSIVVTKDDVCQHQFPPLQQSMSHPLQHYQQQPSFASPPPPTHPLHSSSPTLNSVASSPPPYQHDTSSTERVDEEDVAMPDLEQQQPNNNLDSTIITPSIPQPLVNEPITSNLAAIQTLRLRLRLQSACARMDSVPFSIQPTILQLTIPHDPRIDLIPTPHMRDRMILFRDQFDLDDVFKCLLSLCVFHGGDPSEASNWQLPKVFFEKYWFLTIDYTLQRTTNRWRRLQGLNDLENETGQHEGGDKHSDGSIASSTTSYDSTALSSEDSAALAGLPALEAQQQQQQKQQQQPSLPRTLNPDFGFADLSSYLGVEFSKLEQMQQQQQQQHKSPPIDRVSIPLDMPTSPLQHPPYYSDQEEEDVLEPIRLTNGYVLPQKMKNPTDNNLVDTGLDNLTHRLPEKSSIQQDAWEKMLTDSNHPGYDMLVNSFLHTDSPSS